MTAARGSPLETLNDPRHNKGTAFTEAERDALSLRGLLPPRVFTLAEQEVRVLGNFHRTTSDLEKYIFLTGDPDRQALDLHRVRRRSPGSLPGGDPRRGHRERREVFPRALLQFEDFKTDNAFDLLARYRDRACVFNDDIQGTAAVTLAGLESAGRITGEHLAGQVLLFFGAGEAAIGVADLATGAMEREGLPANQARARCWLVDSKGLIVQSRTDLSERKRAYAQDQRFMSSLEDVVRTVRPTALIGASGQGRMFTEPIVRAMTAFNERPIVFALSNPTSKSECTAGATAGPSSRAAARSRP